MLRSSEPIRPVAAPPAERPELVALGAELFKSPLLSGDGQVSCNGCHLPEHGLADTSPLSHPAGRDPMYNNTPTLWNVAELASFNWNGKFSTLEEHLDGLIQNPRIQDTTWPAISSRLVASAPMAVRFEKVFPDGVTASNARAALLAYERSLATPGAPFDRWLLGEADAISTTAVEGYGLFKSHGCISCHQGVLVGGNLFQRLGVARTYFNDPNAVRPGDLGRYDVTGQEDDRHVFRVPSLRNVALTAPYLHDGSVPTLDQAVSIMATYQLGRTIDREQNGKVVAFLETLTAPRAKGAQ